MMNLRDLDDTGDLTPDDIAELIDKLRPEKRALRKRKRAIIRAQYPLVDDDRFAEIVEAARLYWRSAPKTPADHISSELHTALLARLTCGTSLADMAREFNGRISQATFTDICERNGRHRKAARTAMWRAMNGKGDLMPPKPQRLSNEHRARLIADIRDFSVTAAARRWHPHVDRGEFVAVVEMIGGNHKGAILAYGRAVRWARYGISDFQRHQKQAARLRQSHK